MIVRGTDDADLDALRRLLSEQLSSYKVPRRMTTVGAEQIPLLSSGKVDLRRLAEVFDA